MFAALVADVTAASALVETVMLFLALDVATVLALDVPTALEPVVLGALGGRHRVRALGVVFLRLRGRLALNLAALRPALMANVTTALAMLALLLLFLAVL